MKELKVGVIGLGPRGRHMANMTSRVEDVKITAVCDLFEDRMEHFCDGLEKRKGYRPSLLTTDAMELIDSDEVDIVLIFAAWEVHIPLSIAAMKKGKTVGVEVAGAYSIEQCWELVKTYEETKTPIMMLENCCYAREELMIMNMLKQGLFGEISYVTGGYCHDLRREIMIGSVNKGNHYRFRNYKNRCCDNYPTHQLGPIAQMLNINHGNKFDSLVSVASKSVGMHEFVAENFSSKENLVNTKFNQGDVVTTIIKCSNGETITLTLDTTLPRFYSREFSIHGTKGMFDSNTKSIFVESEHGHLHGQNISTHMDNAKEYAKKYDHPIWVQYEKDGIQQGHGGMDWLVVRAFFDAIKENKPMPIDVYDMATWMAVTPLTEQSIKLGVPVQFPDFTDGKWILDD